MWALVNPLCRSCYDRHRLGPCCNLKIRSSDSLLTSESPAHRLATKLNSPRKQLTTLQSVLTGPQLERYRQFFRRAGGPRRQRSKPIWSRSLKKAKGNRGG